MPDPDVLDPTSTEPVAPVAPAAPPFAVSADKHLVEHDGKRYILEESIQAERQHAQQTAETLAQLEPLAPEIAEFLRQKLGRERATVARAEPQPGESDATEDELKGLAIVRGYYESDGVTPDLKRAGAELNLLARIADRSAARRVGPVVHMTTQDRASQNVQNAMARRYVDGEPLADEPYLRAAFQAIPEEYRADPGIADVVSVIAVGLQALDERRTGRPRRREPAFREGGTGRLSSADVPMDALDRAAARARGKTPEEWAKLSKTVTSRPTTGFDEL